MTSSVATSTSYVRTVWLSAMIGLLVSVSVAWTSGVLLGPHHAMLCLILGLIGTFSGILGTQMSQNPTFKCLFGGLFYIGSGLTLYPIPFLQHHVNLLEPVLIGACIFGVAALFGTTTKRNLSKLVGICFAGLIALILVNLISSLFHIPHSHMVINLVSVPLFAALTMGDSQRIAQNSAMASGMDPNSRLGFALSDSIALYLDLLNIIMSLISLFNGDDD